MKTKHSIVCCITAFLALPVLEAFAGPADFSVELINTFDYPGDVISTQPQKISDRGAVIGLYVDSSLVRRGFVRFMNGHFSAPLVNPNDTGSVTEGRGINSSLLTCGDYLDAGSGTYHGFFLRGSTFHNYDVPGSTTTIVLGLNNAGDFCGSDTPSGSSQSGFVSVGRRISEFQVPGAATTLAYQINSTNQAAGYWIDPSGVSHGFYRDSDGTIVSPIDPAGSTGTIIFGNNDSNYMVGRYVDNVGSTHAFVFIPPATYVIYDYPGSNFTSLNGINAAGLMVGRYLDGNTGIEHGFLARLNPGMANGAGGGTIPNRQAAATPASSQPASRVVEPAF